MESESINDDSNKKLLSLNDIIQEVDQEIQSIYQQCLEAGYSQAEICAFSSPLTHDLLHPQDKKWKKSWKIYFYVVLTMVIMLAISHINWTPVFVSSLGRHALITLLPYWDWTQMYYRTCFVRNPFYEHRKLTDEDCLVCESLSAIMRVSDITHVEMAEDYLKSDIPVIVQDGLEDWNLVNKGLSIQNLSMVLLDSDVNSDVYPCTFLSNLRLRGDNYFRTFLIKLATEDMSHKQWYAHWENCAKTASKALRRLYPRPYFLPPMVDAMEPNWVFASANYRGRIYKEVSFLSDMMWIAQLEGFSRFQLHPRKPCNETCLELDGVLIQGEALVFTDRMWIFKHLPGEDSINVAIGGGGAFEI